MILELDALSEQIPANPVLELILESGSVCHELLLCPVRAVGTTVSTLRRPELRAVVKAIKQASHFAMSFLIIF